MKEIINLDSVLENIKKIEKTHKINVRVPQSLYDDFKLLCDQNNVTLSSFVVGLISSVVNQSKAKK